ncbi:hypothetical protein [Microcoleus sp. K4-C2]|uniref:hypothetical protein n=1 Tax=Microcoleus sp. K4-C2 TaxID=2818792 RepID=UPI002FD604BD
MSPREEEKCSHWNTPPLGHSPTPPPARPDTLGLPPPPLPRVIAVTPVQILSHTLRLRLSRPTLKNVTPIEQ